MDWIEDSSFYQLQKYRSSKIMGVMIDITNVTDTINMICCRHGWKMTNMGIYRLKSGLKESLRLFVLCHDLYSFRLDHSNSLILITCVHDIVEDSDVGWIVKIYYSLTRGFMLEGQFYHVPKYTFGGSTHKMHFI